jgi:hypothetical protein
MFGNQKKKVRLCLVNFVVECCLDKDEQGRIKFVIIYKGILVVLYSFLDNFAFQIKLIRSP